MIGTKRLLLLSAALSLGICSAHAASRLAERGKYLTDIIPCTDCHTPGTFLGHPDMSRYLGGSEVGFAIPGLGVFYGPNLTPDKETGLGKWTIPQIVKAITDGVAPDGRKLAPSMPSEWFHHLTHNDALAIATYLKTLSPVKNKVPGPFGPTQRPVGFVMQVVPAAQYRPPMPPRPPVRVFPGATTPPGGNPAVAPPVPTPSTVPAPVPTPSKTAPPMPMPSSGGGAPVPKPSTVPAPMPPMPAPAAQPPAPTPAPAPSTAPPATAPAPAPSATPPAAAPATPPAAPATPPAPAPSQTK